MAIKIENQVKRRDSTNTCSKPSPISSTWNSNQWRKEDKPPNAKPKIEQEQEVTRQGNQDHESDCDSRPSLEDVDYEEYVAQEELLVARRALSVFHYLLDQGLPPFLLKLLLSPLLVVIPDQCIYLIRMSRYCGVQPHKCCCNCSSYKEKIFSMSMLRRLTPFCG